MKKFGIILGGMMVSALVAGSFAMGYKNGLRSPVIVGKHDFSYVMNGVDIVGNSDNPNENFHSPVYSVFQNADYEVLMVAANADNVDFDKHDVRNIMKAYEKTGINPYLLFAISERESGHNDTVKNKKSTASGQYQFTNVSWFRALKEHAGKYGMQNIADSIQIMDDLSVAVKPKARKKILQMKNDSALSTLLAAENLARDKITIEKAVGRKITDGELYLSHFLGWPTAIKFIKLADKSPKASADVHFATQSKVNGKVMKGKTVGQVRREINEYIRIKTLRYVFLLNKDKIGGTVPAMMAEKT